MKRIIAFLLSFIALVTCFACVCSPTASAAIYVSGNRLVTVGNQTRFYTNGQFDSDYTGAVCVDGKYYYVMNGVVNKKFSIYVDAIIKGSLRYERKVDVSAAKIKYNESKSILTDIARGDIFKEINVEFAMKRLRYHNKGDYIGWVEIEYNEAERNDIDLRISQAQAIRRILYGIENNAAMNDVTKALLIHDRLVLWTKYDWDNYDADTIPKHSYKSTGILGKQVGVCAGYALAYEYLLKRVGINNYYCSSKGMNHAWNIVYINGKKYHVDATWDDPYRDNPNKVIRDHFLVSTNHLANYHGHTPIDYDSSPYDTTYDYYTWPAAETSVPQLPVYLEKSLGKWYLKSGTAVQNITTFYELEGSVYYIENGCLATDKTGVFTAGGKTYCVKNGVVDFDADILYSKPGNYTGAISYEGNVYYIQSGRRSNITGFIKGGKNYYYFKNGVRQKYTGLVNHTNGNVYYVVNGMVNQDPCLYKHTDGKQYYFKNGVRQYSNGIVIGKNAYYNVKNGIKQDLDGFVKSGKKVYYFRDGIASYNGLLKYAGKYRSFKNGLKVTMTGAIKHNNTVYYVKNGVKASFTGIAKCEGKYYYLKSGVKKNYTGFVTYKKKSYYVKKGEWQKSYTGIIKSGSKRYGVIKGIKQTSTRLIKHTDGKTYYLKKGVYTKKTGLMKIGSKRYYIQKGRFIKGTGFVKEGKKYYFVKNGVLSKGSGFVKVEGKKYYIKKGVFQGVTAIVKEGKKYYYVRGGVLICNITTAVSRADKAKMSRKNLLYATNILYDAVMSKKKSVNIRQYKMPAGRNNKNVIYALSDSLFTIKGNKCTYMQWWYTGGYVGKVQFTY